MILQHKMNNVMIRAAMMRTTTPTATATPGIHGEIPPPSVIVYTTIIAYNTE